MWKIKECKKEIRKFLREVYSDENLAQLLAHAQSGKLAFNSCCCLIGLPTANHPLKGEECPHFEGQHYLKTKGKLGYKIAEHAFSLLGDFTSQVGTLQQRDELRRKRIIPMVLAEMKRRDNLKKQQEEKQENVSELVFVGEKTA